MKLFRRTNPKSKFYYLVVVILFTLPVGLLIVGAISLTEANHRSSMISMFLSVAVITFRYNKRAKMWNKHGLEDFKNLTFELVKDGEGYLMEENTTKTGEFFPVRDSCKLEGDPAEGCIETDSFYYSREVYTTDEPIKIQIYHEGRLLINDTLLPTTQRTLNVRQMNCNHNTYSPSSSSSVIAKTVFGSAVPTTAPGTPRKRTASIWSICRVPATVSLSPLTTNLF